jgi:transcription elongation factor GreA
MTEHIKKKLQEEITLLEHELTTELPAEIKRAVALGDLSENAEYHMAKQRQVFVNARLGQLKKRMAELSLVNLANIPRDRVAFGASVVVFDSTKNEEITYKLVTSEKVGDVAVVVTPGGSRELEVLKLTTIHDLAAAEAAAAAE